MLVIRNFVVTLLFICLSIYLVMLALGIAIIILIKNRLLTQINAENRVEFDPPPEYCNEEPPPSYEEALKIGV